MIQTTEVDYILRYNNKNTNRHERQAKYDIMKALGFNSANARRMRDWTMPHIALISQTKIIK
jgi:hypothetical protein